MKIYLEDMSPRRLHGRATVRFTLSQDTEEEPTAAVCCGMVEIIADLRRPADELFILRGLSEQALKLIAAGLAVYGNDVAIRTESSGSYVVVHAARHSTFAVGDTVTV